MARRQKTSVAEDLIELVARLPWWVGVVLAPVLYLLLHRVAAQPVTSAPYQPGRVVEMVSHSMWVSAASVFQYLLPLICVIGAVISVWRRSQRKSLVIDVAQSQAADALDGMSWREFEMLVGEAFRLQGYSVAETGGGGADGGVDLVATKGGEKFLIQCKQWRALKVGVEVVRELYGVMAARGATGGFVVTSGRFTDVATAFAGGRNVKLIDGPKLKALIQQARAAKAAQPPSAARNHPTGETHSVGIPSAAACPVCSKPMVKRVAKRGASAGGEFWGCTGYPACKGTKPVA